MAQKLPETMLLELAGYSPMSFLSTSKGCNKHARKHLTTYICPTPLINEYELIYNNYAIYTDRPPHFSALEARNVIEQIIRTMRFCLRDITSVENIPNIILFLQAMQIEHSLWENGLFRETITDVGGNFQHLERAWQIPYDILNLMKPKMIKVISNSKRLGVRVKREIINSINQPFSAMDINFRDDLRKGIFHSLESRAASLQFPILYAIITE